VSAAEPARTPPAHPDAPGRLLPRMRPSFWVRLDWAVAALCGVLCYFSLVKTEGFDRSWFARWDPVGWLPLLIAGGLAVSVAIRRREPTRALVVALAACVLAMAFGGTITGGAFVPLALVLFSVAATCDRGTAVAGLATTLALLAADGLIMHVTGIGPGDALAVGLVLIIVWLTGYAVSQRRAYTIRVREQVASAAVTEERLRIARELHDVVAHSMTVVAVQAGFGEYVFEREPAEARAALGAIQRVTTEALADMQRLLGVLRHSETAAAEAHEPPQLTPAPGLADLGRLVTTTAGAGLHVELAVNGSRPDLPAAVDQAAFRIVQEALTNVVKHSGAGSCQVSVRCDDGDLCVEITDPGGRERVTGGGYSPADGTGHGIIGMRERVSLCGGAFSAGPLPVQGFQVAARFPLYAAPRNGAAR
jgi:signal transduction histidine kinase